MILYRDYLPGCACARWERRTCGHPWRLQDEWKPFAARGDRAARLYEQHPGIHSIAQATTGLLKHFKLRNPHRIVYFDTEDLMDVTPDAEAIHQQAEAKMLRAGELAEQAKSFAATSEPMPCASPPPLAPRRRRHA